MTRRWETPIVESTQPHPVAGWYADPYARHAHRYWDGSRWTEHVGSHGRQSTDPPVAASRPARVEPTAAGWHADPTGRHERRYFDGTRWTDHVASHGRQSVEPSPQAPQLDVRPEPQQPTNAEPPSPRGFESQPLVEPQPHIDDSLLSEAVLIISTTTKARNGRRIYDGRGQLLGSFEERKRNLGTKVLDRQNHKSDATRSRRYGIDDANGSALLGLTRPEKSAWFSPEMIVEQPNGIPIGYITPKSSKVRGATSAAGLAATGAAAIAQLGGVGGLVAKTALGGLSVGLGIASDEMSDGGHTILHLEVAGQSLATVRPTNAARWEFTIESPSGDAIATITSDWEGWSDVRQKEAHHCVLLTHVPLDDPLRSLVVAASLCARLMLR